MTVTSTFHMELVNYCFDTRYADIMSSRSGLYPREAFHRLASPQTSFGVRSSRIHFSPTDGFSYERVAQFNLEWIFIKLDSGFQSLVGFRILSVVFRIPKPRIPDSTSKKFLDSGIRIPLHGAIQLFLAANIIVLLRKWNHAFLLLAIALGWKWQIASIPEDIPSKTNSVIEW